jgi:hypothetical protein
MIVDSSPKFSGEPTAEALSNGLATLGRYGDNYMVHAAEGETIIPKEILEANPGLKDDLFRQMTMMGIRNPNRYVVGSDLNSINPITGQPEFFFKKLWKATKKIGKKILPVLAPIIGNMIAPGIGGLIASGLVTKMQGGSWGDAAKSAALAYGVGALGRGVQGLGRGQGFFSSLGSGLTEPWRAGRNLFAGTGIPLIGQGSSALNPLAQGIFGPRGTGTLFQGLEGTDFAKPGVGLFPQYQGKEALRELSIDPATGRSLASVQGGTLDDIAGRAHQANITGNQPTPQQLIQAPQSMRAADYEPGTTINRGGNQFKVVLTSENGVLTPDWAPVEPKAEPGWVAGLIGERGADVLGNVASNVAGPLGTAALVYHMSKDEEDKIPDPLDETYDAYLEWQEIANRLGPNSPEARAKKAEWYGQPSYTGTQLASSFGANPLVGITPGTPGAPGGSDPSDLTWIPSIDGPIQPPTLRVNEQPHPLGTGPFGELGLMGAAGGEVMGRGTGTSDSIPARLSDGEFVMTAEAVRNAGGGNRALGAARMYDMMNRFERGAA